MAFKGKQEEVPEEPFTDPHPEKRTGEVGQDVEKRNEVTLAGTTYSSVALRQLSFADIMQQFSGEAVVASEAIESDQYGQLLDKDNKMLLVKQPFLALKWDFNKGDFGEFVTVWCITRDNLRYLLNDGSTGVCAQLRDLTDRTGRTTMLACPKGLRVSEYTYTMPNGSEIPAKTFYIDLSL